MTDEERIDSAADYIMNIVKSGRSDLKEKIKNELNCLVSLTKKDFISENFYNKKDNDAKMIEEDMEVWRKCKMFH